MKKIDEEYIRIFAGLIMLIVITLQIILNREFETTGYVIMGLLGFLIGGAILTKQKNQ